MPPPVQDTVPGTVDEDLQYSNMGYTILGYLIEQITNQSYHQRLKNLILDPLEMEDTGVYSEIGNLVTIFDEDGRIIDPVTINERGAGSLGSTASDMTKYLFFHQNDGSGLISSLEKLHINYPGQDYGFGWY